MTMKKFMTILCSVLVLLILSLLLIPRQKTIANSVTFYYLKAQYAYGQPDGVVGWEQREVGGHEHDLNYLLALYLEGPMSEKLRSPLPEKSYVRVLGIKRLGNTLLIKLSDLTTALTDSEFTLACACLTKTCLGMEDIYGVQITSGNRSVRMSADTIQFYDESTSVKLPETEEAK